MRWSTGHVEEALDLAGVQVDGDDPVGAGDGEQVGEQAGGDRLAPFGLAVLAGVAVERAHRGDALRRRALRGVDHDQLLHDAVVDRLAVALDDEHVGAADALAVAAVELAVGERREHDVAERDRRGTRRSPRRARGCPAPRRASASSSVRVPPSASSRRRPTRHFVGAVVSSSRAGRPALLDSGGHALGERARAARRG